MRETNENRKYDMISAGISAVSIILIIVLLLLFGLKSQIPPPPPKKMVYVDIEQLAGGGGGGGSNAPTPKAAPTDAAQNYATQNAQQNVPSAQKAAETHTSPTPPTPKVNQNAMYKGGKNGNGKGGGEGSGQGSGTGSGLGPGSGSGSGGSIGYGTGNRGMVNKIDESVNEEGQVCVEVHVMADGTVKDARILNNKDYKTTISNATIQEQCKRKAKQAIYKPGKEELRIIIFK